MAIESRVRAIAKQTGGFKRLNKRIGLPRAAITGLGVYLPPKVVTNHDIAKIVDTNDEWIVQRTGIRERRIAEPEETTFTMGLEAARQAIVSARLQPSDIDFIICASILPEYPFPSTACLIQDALEIPNAGAMDLSAACAGFVYALSVANAYVRSGMARNVLVIGSETMSRVVDWQDRATCVLFGDGAGAVVVQATDEDETRGAIESVHLRSDGSKGPFLIIPGGGSKAPTSNKTVEDRMHYIRMNGPEVFKNAVRNMAEACQITLSEANLTLDDLDLVVAHQANSRIIGAVGEKLNVPAHKIFQNVQYYGNTSSASIPIALYDAATQNCLRPGMRIIIAGFGGGLAWGAAVLRWGHVPVN